MPQKIDPLNKKQYGSVTAMLTVTDVKAAAAGGAYIVPQCMCQFATKGTGTSVPLNL